MQKNITSYNPYSYGLKPSFFIGFWGPKVSFLTDKNQATKGRFRGLLGHFPISSLLNTSAGIYLREVKVLASITGSPSGTTLNERQTLDVTTAQEGSFVENKLNSSVFKNWGHDSSDDPNLSKNKERFWYFWKILLGFSRHNFLLISFSL